MTVEYCPLLQWSVGEGWISKSTRLLNLKSSTGSCELGILMVDTVTDGEENSPPTIIFGDLIRVEALKPSSDVEIS